MDTEIVVENHLRHPIHVKAGDHISVEHRREFINRGGELDVRVNTVADYEADEDFIARYAGVFKIKGGGYGGYISAESQKPSVLERLTGGLLRR